jgi:D-3-phosphoglycerate dehydrogenase / 2-oxoglutarate reductase
MRILANDGLVEDGVKHLLEEGFEVDASKRGREALLAEIAGFDALLVRSATKVDREIIQAGTAGDGRLKIVGRAGVGVDNIDLDAARECGVIVKYAPHGNTKAAAELALGLMFAAARRIPQSHLSLKGGVWSKKPFVGEELGGRTLGVVGCGRIGQALATKARAMGMKVLGFDQRQDMDAPLEYAESLDELLREADFVSLHTGGKDVVIGRRELSLMKPTAILINASRGGNVDEDALFDALQGNRLAGAGLDCHQYEPKAEGEPFESRLRALDNVVFTAHLGASTRGAARRTGVEIAEAVARYLRLGDFRQAVNAGETVEEEGREIFSIFITHEDKPGMFGKFGSAFGEMGVNIRENNSRMLKDFVQTVYILHQKPSPEIRARLAAIEGVKRVVL